MNVPNLPIDPLVDKNGHLTDSGKNFFEQLIKELFLNFSNEGLVAPTQTSTNLITIQNNTNIQGQKTCSYGTILYDSTHNSGRFAINDGTGNPIFKTIMLT